MFPHGLQFPGPGGEDCAPDASVAPGREAHALGRTGATGCTAGGDETREGRPLHPDVARLDWLCSSRSWPGTACARMSLRPRGSRTVFRASSVPRGGQAGVLLPQMSLLCRRAQ